MKINNARKTIKESSMGDVARVAAEMLLDGGDTTDFVDQTIGALLLMQSNSRQEFYNKDNKFVFYSEFMLDKRGSWLRHMLNGTITRKEAVLHLCFVGVLLDSDALASETQPS